MKSSEEKKGPEQAEEEKPVLSEGFATKKSKKGKNLSINESAESKKLKEKEEIEAKFDNDDD